MNLSWKLGRVSGIDLFLHPSALLIFFLFSARMPSGIESFALATAFLGSIVLHELGHALMARQYGISTADITLYVFGGVARLERMPRSSGPELLIALAGPAVNLAIVAALATYLELAHWLGLPSIWLLQSLLALNLMLAVFNLLPAFPMDGGRIFRALLSGWVGRLKATETAAAVGRFLAIAGGLYFLAVGEYVSIVLAAFVYFAGSMELRQVRSDERVSGSLGGFVNDVPLPPPGFRWADRGDGVWRLVPILVQSGSRGRSWI